VGQAAAPAAAAPRHGQDVHLHPCRLKRLDLPLDEQAEGRLLAVGVHVGDDQHAQGGSPGTGAAGAGALRGARMVGPAAGVAEAAGLAAGLAGAVGPAAGLAGTVELALGIAEAAGLAAGPTGAAVPPVAGVGRAAAPAAGVAASAEVAAAA